MNSITYTIFFIALYAELHQMNDYAVVFFLKVKMKHQSLNFILAKIQ